MSFFSVLGVGLLLETVLLTLVWAYGQKIKNAAIVDMAWSPSIAILAIFYGLLNRPFSTISMLGLIMACLWGFRLGLHILTRGHHKEDARYTELKEKWGQHAPKKMLHFYWLQGFAATVFSLPFLSSSLNTSEEFALLPLAGITLFLIAFVGESLADWQLQQFKNDDSNKGKVCKIGLWRYSRHPNYFFEWLIWCGFALFAFESPFGFLSILCPILIYHFLVNVTGIPTAEAQSLKSRGEAYREYQFETNPFFPGPVRKQKD